VRCIGAVDSQAQAPLPVTRNCAGAALWDGTQVKDTDTIARALVGTQMVVNAFGPLHTRAGGKEAEALAAQGKHTHTDAYTRASGHAHMVDNVACLTVPDFLRSHARGGDAKALTHVPAGTHTW